MYHVSTDNSRPDNYPPLLRRPRKVNCLHHIQNNNLVSLWCFAWVKFVDNFHNRVPFNVLSHKCINQIFINVYCSCSKQEVGVCYKHLHDLYLKSHADIMARAGINNGVSGILFWQILTFLCSLPSYHSGTNICDLARWRWR